MSYDVGFFVVLVQTVRNSGGSGLVDDSHDSKSWDGTSVLGGLKKTLEQFTRTVEKITWRWESSK